MGDERLRLKTYEEQMSEFARNEDLQWRSLIESEAAKASNIVAKAERGEQIEGAEVRSWWGDVERIFKAMARPTAPTPLPLAMFARIAKEAGYLSAGVLTETVSGAIEQRRPNVGPTEKKHQRAAAAFVLAGREKLLPRDPETKRLPNHTKLVAETFGVDERTVTRWAKEHQGSIDIHDLLPAARIEARMKEAGAAYRVAKAAQKNGSDI